MVWLHPVLGALAASLVVWLGFTGLRGRQRRAGSGTSRARHVRFSSPVLALVLATTALGAGSVWKLRSDLFLANSVHFWVGLGLATLLVGAWFTSRQVRLRPALWALHPYLGLVAMLGAAWAILLGLGLLP